MNAIRRYLLPALCLLLLAGCATNPVSGDADFVLLSEGQEMEIGRKEHASILKRYGRYGDAELQAYVKEVGQRLAARSHRSHLEYSFTLLDSADVNAFALPGGYIYITRGLLAYLNTEAELAAVLGHELGHVTARHSVRQYSAAMAADLGYTLGSLFVPELRQRAAQDLFNVIGSALLSGYGREHELEADRLGAEYLARTGYDPKAMIGVIRVLKNQEQFEIQLAREEGREPRVYHGLFATHPDNDTRLQEVVGAAERLAGATVTRDDSREPFVRRLAGLPFGPGVREGVVRENRFYHAALDFTITLPAGWRVDNQPDRLLAIAPEQRAGLVLTVAQVEGSPTAASFLRSHFNVDRLQEERRLTARGFDGYTGTAILRTDLGARNSRVAAFLRGGQALVVAGITEAESGLERFDAPFLQALESVRTLDAAERALAEPLRLDLRRVGSRTTFTELAEPSPLPHHAEEQLRLLNDYYPEGEPLPGSLLKIVR